MRHADAHPGFIQAYIYSCSTSPSQSHSHPRTSSTLLNKLYHLDRSVQQPKGRSPLSFCTLFITTGWLRQWTPSPRPRLASRPGIGLQPVTIFKRGTRTRKQWLISWHIKPHHSKLEAAARRLRREQIANIILGWVGSCRRSRPS